MKTLQQSPVKNNNHALQVLAGAFPATLDDEETGEIMSTLIKLGITAFVCLQAEFSLDEEEASWRMGIGLRPYPRDAVNVLKTLQKSKKRYALDLNVYSHLRPSGYHPIAR